MHKPARTSLPVLHVVRPAAGGIRQHVLSLVQSIAPTQAMHSIAAPLAFLRSLPPLAAQTAPLEIAPRFAPIADLLAALRLARLSYAVDIVHAHGLRAGWITALAHVLHPFPFVLTAHNLAGGGTAVGFAVRLIGRQASTIIAVSQAVADSLVALGAPPAKLRVIPNGIDTDHFAHLPTRTAARQSLGIPAEPYAIGCIARLSPEKGVDIFTQTAALLPDITFLIAGDGPQRSTLQATLSPNAHLLGRIPDTRALLAAVSILVIPSRSEGQGLVALEAMAAGVPLIATRVGGLAEMLTDNQTALLIPPAGPNALAHAIVRLRNDPALQARITANAARLVRERYALPSTTAAVAAVYAALTAPPPTRHPQP